MQRRTAHALLCAGAVLVASACSGDGRGDASSYVATFTETACDLDVQGLAQEQLRCGLVTMPEDRSNPGGPSVELAVVVARSSNASPAPDPVVVLSGGPGDAMLDSYLPFLQRIGAVSHLQERSDVVLFDQRGTGRSRPALDCPEYDAAMIDILTRAQSPKQDSADLVESLRACHDRLTARGWNLRAYTSAASALDIRDLMLALGYEEWNLYGVSYGSRLALTAMRDAPEGIRSVVLDSVVPLEVDFAAEYGRSFAHALTTLLESCAADPACNAAYPDLEGELYEVVARLNADPLVASAPSPDTGDLVTVVVTGDRLLLGLQQALYDNELIPLLPLVIRATAAGDTALLAAAAADIVTGPLVAEGATYSIGCAEEHAFLDAEAIERGADGVRPEIDAVSREAVVNLDLEVCSFWQAASLSEIENQPVESDIPALVLAGELDPITPTYFGRSVAERLPDALYLEFRGFGHGILASAPRDPSAVPPCAPVLINGFLEAPTAPVDASCVAALPPIHFAGS